MTGRDLIIYILEHNLENEVVYENGKIPGLMSISEAATTLGVGIATIGALIEMDKIGYVEFINDTYVYRKEIEERLSHE